MQAAVVAVRSKLLLVDRAGLVAVVRVAVLVCCLLTALTVWVAVAAAVVPARGRRDRRAALV